MEEPPLRQPQDGEEGEEEEETDAEWSFVDGEMEAVALRDLPTATIACNLDPRVFQDGPCRRERHKDSLSEASPAEYPAFHTFQPLGNVFQESSAQP